MREYQKPTIVADGFDEVRDFVLARWIAVGHPWTPAVAWFWNHPKSGKRRFTIALLTGDNTAEEECRRFNAMTAAEQQASDPEPMPKELW